MKYFPIGIVKVIGNSMLPTFKPGRFLFVSPLPYFFMKPKVNDTVVIRHNNMEIVKRIKRIESNNSYNIIGDNLTESTDSRVYGPVPKSSILAKVIFTTR